MPAISQPSSAATTYALIGYPLGHSSSQRYFTHRFASLGLASHRYLLHETATLAGLRQWIQHEHIAGFNVTAPFKREIIFHLDRLSPTAQAIGAVNCVSIENGLLIGHNTDAQAFFDTLTPLQLSHNVQHNALVLGTGGAALAISHALNQLGIPSCLVSRTPSRGQLSYAQAHQFLLHQRSGLLLINATPVGMPPLTDYSPWPYPDFPDSDGLAYDLIYNPSPTRFLQQAQAAGTPIHDGLAMLLLQAEHSWSIWQNSNSAQNVLSPAGR